MPLQNNIPTYIPLDQAARRHGVSKKVLTQQIQAGKIQAVQLPSGDLLVAAENNGQDYHQTKDEIIARKFANLRSQGISASAASKKYGIHHQNFINWARSGYIRILKEKPRLLEMDEADVAYCAYIYEMKRLENKGRIAGAKIFDKEGNPYQLKYPDLAAQRRG